MHIVPADTDEVWEIGFGVVQIGRILQCCGCDALFFGQNLVYVTRDLIDRDPDSFEDEKPDEVTYWPALIARKPPKWIDRIGNADRALRNLLNEMYSALNNDLRVLAAIGARTAFDRSSELLGVDPTITFRAKLDTLVSMGKISTDEKDVLSVLIDAGSAAAHRGWQPGNEELIVMVDVVETFLHRSFVLGDGIARLKSIVPSRPTR